uniref:Uncharacterized protein n=1 Tax=Opuntia streptacantha TaxID=393608 RepID=A0A7C8ZCV4_OPUST
MHQALKGGCNKRTRWFVRDFTTALQGASTETVLTSDKAGESLFSSSIRPIRFVKRISEVHELEKSRHQRGIFLNKDKLLGCINKNTLLLQGLRRLRQSYAYYKQTKRLLLEDPGRQYSK